jgi:hypothetical protein
MSVSEGFQIPSRIAICNMLNKMLSYILATCAHASLRVTYLRHILFDFFLDTNKVFCPRFDLLTTYFVQFVFFFAMNKFVPLTIIIWVKNYLYLGATNTSVYCNCWEQEAH